MPSASINGISIFLYFLGTFLDYTARIGPFHLFLALAHRPPRACVTFCFFGRTALRLLEEHGTLTLLTLESLLGLATTPPENEGKATVAPH